MKKYKKPIAALLLCFFLSGLSYQNAIAFGAYQAHKKMDQVSATVSTDKAVAPAAIAAVAETLALAYAAGYIVGRAAYYLIGPEQELYAVALVEETYDPKDFSNFDN